ncbi:hypothetical protein SCOCK_210039 [Actinacidiphila cocklensis]|uniref:Core-binding (CB) domain-containing protein n=1 Tax=Actinacidiphila cocklensis TaxID=887465 RepID=A0A9W4DPC7_9ACTN|nr:hypothetical protein SCOCK_210039 [Actinacidiphila cocklensis]
MRLRPFVVRMPSGDRYWTVLGQDELAPIAEVDEFLRHVRFGRDQAESTTATYAAAIKLFLTWCARSGLYWRECVGRLGSFMFWLRYARLDGDPVVPGPGQQPVRGPRRVNTILAGVREFLKHQVAVGNAPVAVLGMLYEVADDRDLPVEVRGEASGPRYYARARHRAAVPDGRSPSPKSSVVSAGPGRSGTATRSVPRRGTRSARRAPGRRGAKRASSGNPVRADAGTRSLSRRTVPPTRRFGAQVDRLGGR